MNRIGDFLDRHFTWLSAALIAFQFLIVLLVVIFFVPGATANTFLSVILKTGASVAGGVTFLGSLLSIYESLQPAESVETDTEAEEPEEKESSPSVEEFVETDDEVMESALAELEGWFSLREDGGIVFSSDSQTLPTNRKLLLYIFAARVAADAGERDSPAVSKDELLEEMEITRNRLPHFRSNVSECLETDFNPASDEVATYELNVQRAPQAAKYIVGEKNSHPGM